LTGDEASGNWRNLDSCKILFNAFASCSSTEVKTDLLRTLQVILSLRVTLPIGQSAMAQMLAASSPSPAASTTVGEQVLPPGASPASRPPLSSGSGAYGQALLGGRSASGATQQLVTVTGYQLLQKRFEPFKTLFLQYDTLTLHNQKMVLGMMDDVLRGSDLLTSELKSYCGLLQGKRPSTILLVSNHLISLIQRCAVPLPSAAAHALALTSHTLLLRCAQREGQEDGVEVSGHRADLARVSG
jgi:hypothetical protein